MSMSDWSADFARAAVEVPATGGATLGPTPCVVPVLMMPTAAAPNRRPVPTVSRSLLLAWSRRPPSPSSSESENSPSFCRRESSRRMGRRSSGSAMSSSGSSSMISSTGRRGTSRTSCQRCRERWKLKRTNLASVRLVGHRLDAGDPERYPSRARGTRANSCRPCWMP